MANKVLLKKSSVAAKVPLTSDLDYGEVALNYTDGKLYFKNASNVIKSFTIDDSVVTLTGTQTLTNKTLTSPVISTIVNTGTLTLPTSTDTLVGRATTDTLTNKTLTSPVISGGTINDAIIGGTTPAAITGSSVTSTGNLVSSYSSGDEGGEILLTKAQTNTTIAGAGVRIDVFQNKLRIWEDGGTNRGAYIDLTAAGAGVGSNLLTGGVGGSGTVTSITAGTGLTGGTITTSGTIAIDSTVATLTGTQTLTNKTFTGNVNANSNLKINCLDGYFTVQQNNSSWTTSTDHPIIKWNYNVTYDDHLYLASGGNQAVSGQSVLVISENNGLLFGRGDTSAVTTLGTKYFQITNTGNVGIGTVSAPASILETEQNTTSSTDLTITNSNTANNITKSSRLRFRLTDSVGTRKDVAYITALPNNLDSSTGGYLTFSTRTLDSTPTEKMRILANGNVGINTTTPGYALEVNGSFAATTKSFVIPHPTKEEMKLRYGSLEGPENGVYIRGRIKENIIELPEYWTKLVDPESISVNLTPVGSHQNLFVEKIEDNKVYIKNSNVLNRTIDCFFVVYGERSDVEKLKVEYAA